MCVRSKAYDQQTQILLSRVLCPSVHGNQRKRKFYCVGQDMQPMTVVMKSVTSVMIAVTSVVLTVTLAMPILTACT
jgi:hypothetical protein